MADHPRRPPEPRRARSIRICTAIKMTSNATRSTPSASRQPKELLGILGVLAMFVVLGGGMVYQGLLGEDFSPRWSAREVPVVEFSRWPFSDHS